MDDLTGAITQNLPELLARDLAEQQNVFLARSITAGPPAVSLTSKAQPPSVPKRNPSRVATRRLHCAVPETDLCSPRPNNMDTAWRYECEAGLKDAASPYAWFQAREHVHLSGAKHFPMKQESEKGERRIFLNGLEEDWSSDSSADVEAGIPSPSVRTRQQSITTAATSVDAHPVVEGRGGVRGCGSVASSPEKQTAQFGGSEGESWVDLDYAVVDAYKNGRQGLGSSMAAEELIQGCHVRPAVFGVDDDQVEQDQQQQISVPRRRSSLSHQVVALGETAHSRKTSTNNETNELTPQPTLPPPQNSPHCSPTHQTFQSDWDSRQPVISSIVPATRCRLFFDSRSDLPRIRSDQLPPPPLSIKEISHWHGIQAASSTIGTAGYRQPFDSLHLDFPQAQRDQLSLPPLSVKEIIHYDASPGSPQQPPNLLSKPRKSQSVSRMPRLINIHSWLDGQPRSPTLSPESPMSMSPVGTTNIRVRVSVEVLDNVRVSVVNFPDTMLLTSSYTVETIRSYLRKVKRSDVALERASVEHASARIESPISPKMRSLGRKASLTNISLMGSLRGKLSSRFGHSPTSINFLENSENALPPADRRVPIARYNTPPSPTSQTQVETREVALRKIFPQGTDYLLDALYAHLIVYNYIDSLCDGLPHLHQNGDVPILRAQPYKSFVLPPGVTSLADLQCQPDVSETVVNDFKADVKHIKSKNVVPTKAAATLGIGSTNMGKPVKPGPSRFRGRDMKLRKTSPCAPFAHSLESDLAIRDLREDVAKNIYRLVETVEACPSSEAKASEEEECDVIGGTEGKELPAVQMRLMCEVVRLNEELNG